MDALSVRRMESLVRLQLAVNRLREALTTAESEDGGKEERTKPPTKARVG